MTWLGRLWMCLKGMMMGIIKTQDAIIDRLVELESGIQYQEYASDSEPEFLHIPGTLPILISAPHGAKHTRDCEDKEEDEYTAGLARLIGERTGAHVLYARRRSRTDPNAAFDAPYKQSLLKIVQDHQINFVLDLHGAKAASKFGIALGTGKGISCNDLEKQTIIKTFEKHNLSEINLASTSRLDIDQQWPGLGNDLREPIIKFCKKHAIPAAQLEINARLRIPKRKEDSSIREDFTGDTASILNLVNALTDLVVSLSER